jgi:NTP pyrophosphatase (non-canonical NTP hydrolase)
LRSIDEERGSMNSTAYQEQTERTVAPCQTVEERLTLAALGMAGETGEVVDLVKKHLFNHKEVNVEKIKDECGDVLWYMSILLNTLGLTFEDVMQGNIEKLRRRHTNGFTPTYASDSGTSAQ